MRKKKIDKKVEPQNDDHVTIGYVGDSPAGVPQILNDCGRETIINSRFDSTPPARCVSVKVYGRREIKKFEFVDGQTLTNPFGSNMAVDWGWLSAKEIAAGFFKVADTTTRLEDRGFFICAGDKPTEKEIVEAETRRNNFRRRLVMEADGEYAKTRDPRRIRDEARWAVWAVRQKREWAPTFDPFDATVDESQPAAVTA